MPLKDWRQMPMPDTLNVPQMLIMARTAYHVGHAAGFDAGQALRGSALRPHPWVSRRRQVLLVGLVCVVGALLLWGGGVWSQSFGPSRTILDEVCVLPNGMRAACHIPGAMTSDEYERLTRQIQRSVPQVIWLGSPVVGKESGWPVSVCLSGPCVDQDIDLRYELGLRADGVVVWRTKGEGTP